MKIYDNIKEAASNGMALKEIVDMNADAINTGAQLQQSKDPIVQALAAINMSLTVSNVTLMFIAKGLHNAGFIEARERISDQVGGKAGKKSDKNQKTPS